MMNKKATVLDLHDFGAHTPTACLEGVLREIRSGRVDAHNVVVVVQSVGEPTVYSSGKHMRDAMAAMGLLHTAIDFLSDLVRGRL